jgi:phosphoribosylamine---glycine ligase
MLTADGPKILEYNCRVGDPETVAVLLRADFDFAEAGAAAARGGLGGYDTRWFPGASLCVVIASEGYPGNPVTGRRIAGLEEAAKVPGSVIFHAGTHREGKDYFAAGGRVLAVSARGESLEAASQIAYEAAGKIRIEGAFYRRDIGRAGAQRQAAVETRRAN